jgi:hypothetical protein
MSMGAGEESSGGEGDAGVSMGYLSIDQKELFE